VAVQKGVWHVDNNRVEKSGMLRMEWKKSSLAHAKELGQKD